jgi:hypothetical protein
MPLAALPDGTLVPVEVDLSPLPAPVNCVVDVMGDTNPNIEITTPQSDDGSLHVALPLAESHSELLDLAKECQAVLLVHGTAMIGERNQRLCDRLDIAIRKAKGLR